LDVARLIIGGKELGKGGACHGGRMQDSSDIKMLKKITKYLAEGK
jgi:hypothetical protein